MIGSDKENGDGQGEAEDGEERRGQQIQGEHTPGVDIQVKNLTQEIIHYLSL